MPPPEPTLVCLGTVGTSLYRKSVFIKQNKVPALLCRPQPVHPHVPKTALIFLWTNTLGVDSLNQGRML